MRNPASLALALCLLLAGASSQALVLDSVIPEFPSFSEGGHDIRDVEVSGGKGYVGGSFWLASTNRTGPAVPLSLSTAEPAGAFPFLVSEDTFPASAQAIVDDGAGGWFLGGHFSCAGGSAHLNLVHVLADGSVDNSWNPNPSWPSPTSAGVRALVRSGSTLYVGGVFNSIGGQSRGSLAALDTAGGTVLPWTANASGIVQTMALSGGTLFVGGNLWDINGSPVSNLAAVDAASGSVLAWNPGPGSTVLKIDVVGSRLYAAGPFLTMGGSPATYLAAVDTATGANLAWNPVPNGGISSMDAQGATVYVGGAFSSIGGMSVTFVAALDGITGAALSWNPAPDGQVDSILATPSAIYIGGQMWTVGGAAHPHLAALNPGTAVPLAWAPQLDGNVAALAQSGGVLYAGGGFNGIDGGYRNGLADVDLGTGALGSLFAEIGWGDVRDMEIVGNTLYFGGSLTDVNGSPRQNAAALDLSSGNLLPWAPSGLGVVYRMKSVGGMILVGHQGGLTALDPASGLTLPWGPGLVDGNVWAVEAGPATIYIGGDFATIGGSPRARLAALDRSTGALLSWTADSNNFVRDLHLEGNNLYVAGNFSVLSGGVRNALGLVDASTGSLLPWNPVVAPTGVMARSFLVQGSELYVGGDFLKMDGVYRRSLAAFDLASGTLLSWDPSHGTGYDPINNAMNPVNRLAYGSNKLLAALGSPTLSLGCVPLKGLAVLGDPLPPLPTPTAPPSQNPSPEGESLWITSSSGTLPFNPERGDSLRICVQAYSAGQARVEIYNLLGERVNVLYQDFLAKGESCWDWQGLNDQAALVAPGSYLVLFSMQGQEPVTKIVTLVR